MPVNVNSYMVWGMSILRFVGRLAILNKTPKDMRMCGRAWWGMVLNCFTFAYFAALACMKWIPGVNYGML